MSAAEAVFHAKAPADKKASAQAAIRKRFLMVVIMGLLSGGRQKFQGGCHMLDAELEIRNEKWWSGAAKIYSAAISILRWCIRESGEIHV